MILQLRQPFIYISYAVMIHTFLCGQKSMQKNHLAMFITKNLKLHSLNFSKSKDAKVFNVHLS